MLTPEEIAKKLLKEIGSHDEMCMELNWNCDCLNKILEVLRCERERFLKMVPKIREPSSGKECGFVDHQYWFDKGINFLRAEILRRLEEK